MDCEVVVSLGCKCRRAKVKTRYQRQFNSAVEEWEKEVCIFQQRVVFDAYRRRNTTVHTGSSKFKHVFIVLKCIWFKYYAPRVDFSLYILISE